MSLGREVSSDVPVGVDRLPQSVVTERKVKPGWQTTEFWVVLGGHVIGAGVAIGILTQGDAVDINTWIGKTASATIAFVALVLQGIYYIKSRTMLKKPDKPTMKGANGFPIVAIALLMLGAFASPAMAGPPGIPQAICGCLGGCSGSTVVPGTAKTAQPVQLTATRYMTYDEGWRMANATRRNLVVCRGLSRQQLYLVYVDAVKNGWIFCATGDNDTRVKIGVTDYIFVHRTSLRVGFVSLRCCPRNRDPVPSVPQTDPAVMMALNQIMNQNGQIMAMLMAMQSRPAAPAPASPPVVLVPLGGGTTPIVSAPIQQPTPIVYSPPQQTLPIGGAPQQVLPIGGAPQQLLPIAGTPQQTLPITGHPQQIINIHGAPQQTLPITSPQFQQLPVAPQPIMQSPAPLTPPITVPVPVQPVPVPPQQQLPIGPQPVRSDDAGPPAPYPQSFTAIPFRR